jgi:hypothetical protein
MDNVYKVAEKSGNNMFVVSMKEMAYLKRWRQIRRGVEQFLDEASDSDLGEEQLNHTVLHGSLANVNCESMDECSLEHCKHLDDCEVSCHGNEDLSFEKSDSDAVGPSSDEMEEADVVSDMRSDLAQWGLRHGCSRTCINELLDILRKQGHDLPKDVRTLMKTPSTIQITKKCGGDYVYFGIERHLQEVLNDIDTVPNEFSLKINVDGLPLFRSSSTQLWTILCSTDINVPFLVALFCGEKKPSSAAEFLEDKTFETYTRPSAGRQTLHEIQNSGQLSYVATDENEMNSGVQTRQIVERGEERCSNSLRRAKPNGSTNSDFGKALVGTYECDRVSRTVYKSRKPQHTENIQPVYEEQSISSQTYEEVQNSTPRSANQQLNETQLRRIRNPLHELSPLQPVTSQQCNGALTLRRPSSENNVQKLRHVHVSSSRVLREERPVNDDVTGRSVSCAQSDSLSPLVEQEDHQSSSRQTASGMAHASSSHNVSGILPGETNDMIVRPTSPQSSRFPMSDGSMMCFSYLFCRI